MHYDFIEIGTSDFDTLAENSRQEVGISIDPIKFYLDKLPNRKNLKKINCAVGDKDKIVSVYYVHPDDINHYNLPLFLKGCNSIINPHPTVLKILEQKKIKNILRKFEINCYCWETLVKKYEINSVDFLKIDTEGHDCCIINNLIDSKLNIFPKKLKFENNSLSDENIVKKTLDRLFSFGYKIIKEKGDIEMIKCKIYL